MQCFVSHQKKENETKVVVFSASPKKKKKNLPCWHGGGTFLHSLPSLKDKFSSAVSQRRIRQIENRSSDCSSSRPRIRLPSRADYWQCVPKFFFGFHNIRVVVTVEILTPGGVGQRLMGSCGREMDGWVKWPGGARTEKGWPAGRRQERQHELEEPQEG